MLLFLFSLNLAVIYIFIQTLALQSTRTAPVSREMFSWLHCVSAARCRRIGHADGSRASRACLIITDGQQQTGITKVIRTTTVSSKRAGRQPSTAERGDKICSDPPRRWGNCFFFDSRERERERKTERYKSNVNNRQNGKKKHPAFQTILGY